MPFRNRAVVLLPLITALIACEKTEEPRVAKALRLTPETQLMFEATSQQFTATVLDENGQPIEGRKVSWQSDHREWVTVDSNGLATAIAIPQNSVEPPPIVITASSGALKASATITLARDGTFEAWPDTNVLYTGMTRELKTWLRKSLSGYPSPQIYDVPGSVTWKSESPAIVTVSDAGIVTAVAPGHARVVATFGARAANVEVYVSTPPAPLRFTAVASEATFLARNSAYGDVFAGRSCGLTLDGAIYCWGAFADPTQPADRCTTTHGGAGRYTQFRYRCTEIPQRVQTNLIFTGLAVGGNYTCGLAKQVYCWGENKSGELGIGAADQTTHGIAPVAGTDEFIELHGSRAPCAIRSDGVLRCWGPGFGASPTTVGSGMTWRTIAEAGACGLRSDSTAYCWGATPTPVAVGGSTRWKSIATGGYEGLGQVCGITIDDSVFCGLKLEAKQPVTESILRLAGYTTSIYSGFGQNVCGLTATGSLICPDAWTAVGIAVKVKASYGLCLIAADDKVYCRTVPNGTYVLLPGQ